MEFHIIKSKCLSWGCNLVWWTKSPCLETYFIFYTILILIFLVFHESPIFGRFLFISSFLGRFLQSHVKSAQQTDLSPTCVQGKGQEGTGQLVWWRKSSYHGIFCLHVQESLFLWSLPRFARTCLSLFLSLSLLSLKS